MSIRDPVSRVLEETRHNCNTVQQTAMQCNTPQQTATHCNTLQHTRNTPATHDMHKHITSIPLPFFSPPSLPSSLSSSILTSFLHSSPSVFPLYSSCHLSSSHSPPPVLCLPLLFAHWQRIYIYIYVHIFVYIYICMYLYVNIYVHIFM